MPEESREILLARNGGKLRPALRNLVRGVRKRVSSPTEDQGLMRVIPRRGVIKLIRRLQITWLIASLTAFPGDI
jgi:hypothetical protein